MHAREVVPGLYLPISLQKKRTHVYLSRIDVSLLLLNVTACALSTEHLYNAPCIVRLFEIPSRLTLAAKYVVRILSLHPRTLQRSES